MKPGLKVRLSETLTDMVRQDLLSYGTAYLNFDYQHKSDGMIRVSLFPIFIDFFYHNLTHDKISLDMHNLKFLFTHMASDSKPVVYTRLPMVRDWSYNFKYAYSWLGLPFKGDMTV